MPRYSPRGGLYVCRSFSYWGDWGGRRCYRRQRAWSDGQRQPVRFRVEPVELTVQVAVTRTVNGTAGVKWYVLAFGAGKSRETVATQTLKLRLTPVLSDGEGNELQGAELLISDRDDDDGDVAADVPAHEPE